MARKRKGVMSEELKYELAKDLGFYDTVQKEGWGGIRAKDAGNMVKRALQIAEKTLAEQAGQAQPTRPAGAAAPASGYRGAPVSAAAVPVGATAVAAPARGAAFVGASAVPTQGRYRS